MKSVIKSTVRSSRPPPSLLSPSGGSSEKQSIYDDESYDISNRRKIKCLVPKRGRGRPPKPRKSSRKSINSCGEDDQLSDMLSPKLPAKRGRPRLRPLGVQLDSFEDDEKEEGLFDLVGKRRRRGGRVVD